MQANEILALQAAIKAEVLQYGGTLSDTAADADIEDFTLAVVVFIERRLE